MHQDAEIADFLGDFVKEDRGSSGDAGRKRNKKAKSNGNAINEIMKRVTGNYRKTEIVSITDFIVVAVIKVEQTFKNKKNHHANHNRAEDGLGRKFTF